MNCWNRILLKGVGGEETKITYLTTFSKASQVYIQLLDLASIKIYSRNTIVNFCESILLNTIKVYICVYICVYIYSQHTVGQIHRLRRKIDINRSAP